MSIYGWMLYCRFIYRRKVEGLTVDCYWLRNAFLQLLNEYHPGHQFKLSNGWLFGFCNRYPISNQMTTEKKFKSVEERLPMIEQFHRKIYQIQNIFPQVM